MTNQEGSVILKLRIRNVGENMFNKKRFKAEVELAGLTLYELCEKLGMNASTMYRKTTGTSEFTRKEIQEIRDILGISPATVDAIFFATEVA